jgi:hypothetical protein
MAIRGPSVALNAHQNASDLFQFRILQAQETILRSADNIVAGANIRRHFLELTELPLQDNRQLNCLTKDCNRVGNLNFLQRENASQ